MHVKKEKLCQFGFSQQALWFDAWTVEHNPISLVV